MPRARRSDPVVIPSNSLVASAARYPGKAARIYNQKQDWQTECYRHYNICGEARQAADFLGHSLSRSILKMARKTKDGLEVQTEGPAVDLLDELFNGSDGQSQMLEAVGIHLTVAGECYLVGRQIQPEENHPTSDTIWEIVSVLEMHVTGNTWSIRYGDDQKEIRLDEEDVVIRIWTPNPAKRIEAHSPFRSLLPILVEIEYLTKRVFAMVQSGLTGAGVWPLPQSLTFPPPPPVDGKPQTYTNEAEGAMLSIGGAMMRVINDPASPEAVVPTIIQVPDEAMQYIKEPIHFWSPLDQEARELRREAIVRFAVGINLPPEQVLGMSANSGTGGGNSNGVSHWGAWQIEESTIKMNVEPMLNTVVNAVTMGYIRPITQDPADVTIYDTGALRLRPDRSKESIELYDRGLLSLSAMLRENGFDPADQMSEEEFHDWLLRKIASGSATPEMVYAAAEKLGLDLGPLPELHYPQHDIGSDPSGPNESRPDPSLEDHPTRPRTPAEAALFGACDALVFRALERAGNRLRQAGSKPPVPSFETHTVVSAAGKEAMLLTDAWPCANQVIEGWGEADKVIPVLNAYATHLLATGTKHSRGEMIGWLRHVMQEAS